MLQFALTTIVLFASLILAARLPPCGGVAGLTCPDGFYCVDKKGDGCNPRKGGADCIGICRPQCGGIAGLTCPSGFHCVDLKGDGCNPSKGGADCIGVCRKNTALPIPTNTATAPPTSSPQQQRCGYNAPLCPVGTYCANTETWKSCDFTNSSMSCFCQTIRQPPITYIQANTITMRSSSRSPSTLVTSRSCQQTICADYTNSCGQFWWGT